MVLCLDIHGNIPRLLYGIKPSELAWYNPIFFSPCIAPYFFLEMRAKPEQAHRLQTSEKRRNSTSLNTCLNNVNIVTKVARRLCTPFLKPRSSWGKHFTLQVNICRPRAIILRTGAERGYLLGLKTMRMQSFACMCKEKSFLYKFFITIRNIQTKILYALHGQGQQQFCYQKVEHKIIKLSLKLEKNEV